MLKYGSSTQVSHLCGEFSPDSIETQGSRVRYLRVVPDAFWDDVEEIEILADMVYESERIASTSRRHVYGTGDWYVSPERPERGDGHWLPEPGMFKPEDVRVIKRKEAR